MDGKKLFFHRLFRNHTWKTIDEYKIPGIDLEKSGFSATGFCIEDTMDRLRSGFKVVHQECIVCGDRRTLHKY